MIRKSGFNTVRAFLTHDASHRDLGIVHAGRRKIQKIPGGLSEVGNYIVPSGPDHWDGVPSWRQGTDAFANETQLRADEEWWWRYPFTGQGGDAAANR